MNAVYPTLETKVFERGIKQLAIARALGISQKALYNKRQGKVPFTWPEACIIQSQFFPEMSKDDLFTKNTMNHTS